MRQHPLIGMSVLSTLLLPNSLAPPAPASQPAAQNRTLTPSPYPDWDPVPDPYSNPDPDLTLRSICAALRT